MFYMSFVDFKNYFSEATICYYHENYLYKSHSITSNWKHATFTQMKVISPGYYYITINQKNALQFARVDGY